MPAELVSVVHKVTGRKARIARAALKHYPAYKVTGSQDATDRTAAGVPARNASKADWVDHAVSLGVDRTEAEGLSPDELAELYTPTTQEA